MVHSICEKAALPKIAQLMFNTYCSMNDDGCFCSASVVITFGQLTLHLNFQHKFHIARPNLTTTHLCLSLSFFFACDAENPTLNSIARFCVCVRVLTFFFDQLLVQLMSLTHEIGETASSICCSGRAPVDGRRELPWKMRTVTADENLPLHSQMLYFLTCRSFGVETLQHLLVAAVFSLLP